MTRMLRFALVGASGAVIGLGLLWLLTELTGWHYLASYTAAFVVSVCNNYLWNSLWTFKGRKPNLKSFSKYATISTVTLGINLTLVYVLTDIVGLWYMFSAVVGVLTSFLINFGASRRWVWNRQKEKRLA